MAVLPVALFSSCSNPEVSPADRRNENACSIRTLLPAGKSSVSCRWIDVFTYDAAEGGRLDSYERVNGMNFQVHSTSGRKRIAAIANMPDSSFDYSDIISYGNLKNMVTEMRNDNPSCPVMSGELVLENPGPGKTHYIELTPVMSRVYIKKFTVDFSSRPYRNEELTDTRAYLLNVNGICRIMADSAVTPTEIINYGRLDSVNVRHLPHPETVFSEKVENAEMFCYPCSTASGTFGTCTTRLVIEGKIKGQTYYYPIDIGAAGVGRGKSYVFDITVTRSGTTSPDIPAQSDMLTVNITDSGWNEYENENIEY